MCESEPEREPEWVTGSLELLACITFNLKIEAVLSRNVKILYFLPRKCRLRAVSRKRTNLRGKSTPQFIPPWLSKHHTFSFSHLLFFDSNNILNFHISATCFTCPDNNALVGGGDVQQEGSATPDIRQYFGRTSKSWYSILSHIKKNFRLRNDFLIHKHWNLPLYQNFCIPGLSLKTIIEMMNNKVFLQIHHLVVENLRQHRIDSFWYIICGVTWYPWPGRALQYGAPPGYPSAPWLKRKSYDLRYLERKKQL